MHINVSYKNIVNYKQLNRCHLYFGYVVTYINSYLQSFWKKYRALGIKFQYVAQTENMRC